jgi:hypothetical protein
MNCKCNELTNWLKKEIKHLEEIRQSVTHGSSLHNNVDAKILAYTVVLNGLTN